MSAESGLVAKRYASALLDLAAEARAVESIEKDMSDLQAMIESSADLRTLIGSPMIARADQAKAVAALAEKAKFHKLTANFLGLLVENRRLFALPGVLKAFRSELTRRRGAVEARVQVAYALTPAQTQALQEQLSKALGSHVSLNIEVNKDILGGMIVTYGSRMIDDSVRRKLERLQRVMNANENTSSFQKEVG